MVASKRGYVDTVKILLDNGANVNIKENSGNQTALKYASDS
jgi:ankyrin repeat protein